MINDNDSCVSYGNLSEGIQGYGSTIKEAISDFNKQFTEPLKDSSNAK